MNIPFVPADPSNYYPGRGGNSIKYIVMHYTAQLTAIPTRATRTIFRAQADGQVHTILSMRTALRSPSATTMQHGTAAALSRVRITRYAAFV